LKKLAAIDYKSLDSGAQVNYDMFKFKLEDDVAQVEYQSYLIPFNSDSGFHTTFAFAANDFDLNSVASYEQYIGRLRGFKKYVDDHIALMRIGIKKGMTLPKIILTDYEKGMDAYISKNPEDSYFYIPFRIEYYTTLDISMEEVYQVGLEEVARIRKGIYCDTPECLLKEACYIAKRIDGRLPRVFGKLPSLPYGVEPVPDEIAPRYTTGRYVPGSYANHKSGTYWVNTYDLKNRPLYNLPALTLHEAVPGHHLQIALAEELKDLPDFRQHTYLSSYGEGWALYSEWLGQELGIYTTPYEEFGRYAL